MKLLIFLCTALSFFIVLTLISHIDRCTVGYLEVHFINVGQGDAAYILTPSGADILVDTGPENIINKSLGDILHFTNNTFDAVFVTHFDLDHSGGLPILLRNFDVKYLITASVYEKDDPLLEEVISLQETDNRFMHTTVSAGDRIEIDQKNKVYFEVLSPNALSATHDINNQSLVMRLVYEESYFLFMGDADQSVEKMLMQKYPNSVQAHIIKIGHHGSRSSSHQDFIKNVSPDFAIISAGLDNSYGHPHQEVITTLKKLNIEIKETKLKNHVFYSDGKNIWEKETAPKAPCRT